VLILPLPLNVFRAMNIRLALPSELNEVYQLYADARIHLRGQGIHQWSDNYPSRQTTLLDIEREELFVLEKNQHIYGAICLNERQDDQYKLIAWRLNDDNPLVIHRLVIAPDAQGGGLARQLMDFAEKQALDRGYLSIRLDAYTGHERVRRFYEQRGYVSRGMVFFEGRELPFWCFELEA
jgi:GNAT superfamily N-acetyltransferase